jgi:hypothetical protein
MFFQFKSETLYRLKLISDSIQVKLCQIEKKNQTQLKKPAQSQACFLARHLAQYGITNYGV